MKIKKEDYFECRNSFIKDKTGRIYNECDKCVFYTKDAAYNPTCLMYDLRCELLRIYDVGLKDFVKNESEKIDSISEKWNHVLIKIKPANNEKFLEISKKIKKCLNEILFPIAFSIDMID